MEGVTIIQTKELEGIRDNISTLTNLVIKLAKEVKVRDPWFNLNDAAEYMGKSYPWIFQNKHKIGCSKIGGEWMIRQSSIEEFFNQAYHKDR